jgi:hypothetical protein
MQSQDVRKSVFDTRFGKYSKRQDACNFAEKCTRKGCTFSHPPKEEVPVHKNHQAKKICKNGADCTFGDKCHFAHPCKVEGILVAAPELKPASKKFAFNPHVAVFAPKSNGAVFVPKSNGDVFVPQCECGAFLYGGSLRCYQCIEDEDEMERALDEFYELEFALALAESEPAAHEPAAHEPAAHEPAAPEPVETQHAFVFTLKKRS